MRGTAYHGELCQPGQARTRPGGESQLNGGSDDVSNGFPDHGVGDRGRL